MSALAAFLSFFEMQIHEVSFDFGGIHFKEASASMKATLNKQTHCQSHN